MITGKGKDKKEWNERKKAAVRVYKAEFYVQRQSLKQNNLSVLVICSFLTMGLDCQHGMTNYQTVCLKSADFMTLGDSQRFSVSLNVYIVKLIWFITMSLHSFFALQANFENVDTPN